ncbi:ABC transporter substrate-binding protein [Actinosynnema sp.]|uniref:ABC transporter substrate-binding protein n=1 Tax=Actinosynnema sp. TaxID=1872144 RepID=UPI003F83A9FD
MRTKWKRPFTALVAGGLVAGLVACSGDDPGSGPVDLDGKRVGAMADFAAGTPFRATEPLDFGILYNDHANYPIKNEWLLWSELTSRTNVTLKPTVVPNSDYDQKRSLVIGAGDAPEIISKTYPGMERPFVASGAILPVSDYLDLMPNFKAKVEKWGLKKDLEALRQDDGKFYVLPGLHEAPWQDYTLAFRTDELTRLGIATPKDWDEVYTALKAIKAAHPDSYPLSDRFEGKALLNVLGMTYGTAAGWGYVNATWDEKAQKLEYSASSPQYRAMLEYLRKLVAEGLLDPESFTRKDDQIAIRKFANGESFANSATAQNVVNDYRPGISGIPGATVAKIPLPAGPAGNLITGSRLENGLMIPAKAAESEHFVAMMQYVDWVWYSEEGQELVKWGVPGTTYDKDASGKRVLNPGITYAGTNTGAPKHLQKDFGFAGGVFAYGGPTELLRSTFTDEEIAFQEEMAKKTPAPLVPPYPFTEEERERASLWETPLKDYANQSALQFILGDRDLSTWDAYVSELDAKGRTQFVDLANSAHQRYKQKNG